MLLTGNLSPLLARLFPIGNIEAKTPKMFLGRDTAGALSIGKAGSSDPGGWIPVPDAVALERIINELPSKPFLVGEDGVSMSLAGVQHKLGVALNPSSNAWKSWRARFCAKRKRRRLR